MQTIEITFERVIVSYIILGCLTMLLWILATILFSYTHFIIAIKEYYWSAAPENEFMIKLKCIISHVDKDFVFFSTKNLAYKLNFIYSNMSISEKRKFRNIIFQNGMRHRIKYLINNYD
jgi:hypothetical protein